MTKIFKIKRYWVFTLGMMLFSLASFAQTLSDEIIGFDVARATASLKEHGVKDEDLAREITMMREMQQSQYVEMKKVEDNILQKIQAEQVVKTQKKSSGSNAKIAAVDIPWSERQALKAFYNSMGGVNWNNTLANNKSWKIDDDSSDVATWFGIAVVNGHVSGLTLPSNNLTGNLQDLSALANLTTLDLSYNNFGGSMPSWFSTMTSLNSLKLTFCRFTGPVPDLSALTSLSLLNLGSNSFGGIMPTWLSTMESLEILLLADCRFIGPVSDLSQLNNLKILELGNNDLLGGSMPSWLSGMTKMKTLSLGYCGFTGSILDLSSLEDLNTLILGGNNFNTTIPSWLYTMNNLEVISMGNCNLKGEISTDIQNLTKLRQLLIHDNNLEGSIPTEFNKLTLLNNVWLVRNKLSGVVPNLTALPLQQFLISENKFRFIDFVDEFQAYKIKMPNSYNNNPFYYSPQAKINVPVTITKGSGQFIDLKMYPDGDTRYLANDTYQWFKNGTAIADATSPVYTIPSLTTADAAIYICKSYHLSNPDMSPLVLEREPITLNVVNGCVIGTIENPTPANTVDGITVSFNTTATGLTYAWRFYYLDGTTSGEVFTNPIATRRFDQPGPYRVTLEVTTTSGCKANFEKMVTVTHNCVAATGNIRIQNSKSDTEVVAGYPADFDFVGNLWINSSEWKFYNPDGTIKDTQNPTANGVSQTFTTPGTYKVMVTIKDYYDCPTTIEKMITVLESCEIPASERRDYGNYPFGIHTMNQERLTTDSNNLINTPIKIFFYGWGIKTDSDFVYSWKIYDPIGTLIQTSTVSQPMFTPTIKGNYRIDLHIIDKVGCTSNYSKTSIVTDICEYTESRRSFYITSSDGGGGNTLQVNTNQPFNMGVNFSEESENENSYSYNWKLYNSNNELISSATTSDFPLTLTTPDFYKCTIEVTEISTGCISTNETYINSLKTDSCTEQNPKSAEVKRLVVNLLKKLIVRSLLGETDEQINTTPLPVEFDALKPYITNLTGNKIYNYKTIYDNDSNDSIRAIRSVKFSFSPEREYDVHVYRANSFKYDIDNQIPAEELHPYLETYVENRLYINSSEYVSPNQYMLSCEPASGEDSFIFTDNGLNPYSCREWSEVRYIDFCPANCLPTEGVFKVSSESPIVNTSTKFSFETTATNLTYIWTVTNSANVVVDTLSNTTGLYSFIPNTQGSYTVSLKVVTANQCETAFSKTISVTPALPIADCETHFNFNFKLPSTDSKDIDIHRGTILNNIEREHIANGIIKFVNDNKNKKLYITTYDDTSGSPRLGVGALQNTYTTDFDLATTNTSNETLGGFFRFQDQFYDDTFRKIISIAPGILSQTGITKKIDVSFFVISEDSYTNIAASKAAYTDLLNSAKTNKIFFIFLDEGKFKTPSHIANTYITPIEFASQLKGSAAINYSATGNVMTSDFISYSKAQIADGGFDEVLKGFLNQCYAQAKTKKCTTAGCVATNSNAQIVKSLFVNLVNKLQSLPAGTVNNGYTCAELIALKPYIKVPNPAIYNYNNGSFSFSNLINNYDVFMGGFNAQVTDINLESYVNSETETNFIAKYGTIEKGCSVKHIDFCATAYIPTTGEIVVSTENPITNTSTQITVVTNKEDLTYTWIITDSANQIVGTVTDNTGTYTFIPTAPGTYTIIVKVTDENQVETEFIKIITVIDLLPLCVNNPVNLSFETPASANINYNWYTVKEGSTTQLSPMTNTTGHYTFNPTEIGNYTVHLTAYERNECKFEFSKAITVDTCDPSVSCTKNNPNTPIIKSLFVKLANKLVNSTETITNGYTCDELKVLAYYIKDQNPAIYNFEHNQEQGYIAFSFSNHPNNDYDVKIATNGDHIVDFNLDNYKSNDNETVLITPTSSTVESHVKHVNFCSELYCLTHIAIVVDESGSINTDEANRIKKQLKNYIRQQAYDNDKLQSNIYVSLTGMSDSDINNRKDNIEAKRLTLENPAVLKEFNNWIDKYRNRKDKNNGISESSDYWKSGLDVALNSKIKPSIVLMITDGCETSNVEELKNNTMSKFNNFKNSSDTSPDKPHLYVIGIENGFYVDREINGTTLTNNLDPNYSQTVWSNYDKSRVAPVLRTSLRYLLNYGEKFPEADIANFRGFDYYGYNDEFRFLGLPDNDAFLSDNLKITGYSCGDPTDKNYCSDCLSFQPVPDKEYMLSAWVKEDLLTQVKTYGNAIINVVFYKDVDTSDINKIGTEVCITSGDIIDGWQRIIKTFKIPENTKTIGIELENKSNGIPAYFDDIRIHPLDGSVKTFVYDSETFKLMSELDENNYSTFYEYDNEGGLVRVKKETARGVKTIQETRSGNVIDSVQN